MKKIIKVVSSVIIVSIHLGIELYPTGKIFAKNYISSIDFKSALNTGPIAKYVAFLAEDEKNNLVTIIESLLQNESKK